MRKSTAAALVLATTLIGSPAGVAAATPGRGSTCAAADLNATLGRIDPGAGQRASFLTLSTDTGGHCVISGHLLDPHFVDGTGAVLPTKPDNIDDGCTPAVVIDEKHTGQLSLRWTGIPVADGDDPDAPAPAGLRFKLDGVRDPMTLIWTGGKVFNGGHLIVGAVHATA